MTIFSCPQREPVIIPISASAGRRGSTITLHVRGEFMLPMDPTSVESATPRPESIRPVVVWSQEVPYSVPRRFGLGAMLVITTAFAGLFALLRALSFDIVVVMAATIYLLGIALAQMCFPKWPRAASIITGTVLFPLVGIPVCYVLARWIGDYNFRMGYAIWVGVPLATISMGPVFGYLSGTVGAGLFLLMDRYRPGKLAQQVETRPTAVGSVEVGYGEDRETASVRGRGTELRR
jgi:hypothetical protein